MYTKKQFLEDVAKEAKALKEHATPEELAKLDFRKLDPHSSYSCIYGQMTGSCVSERANELISNCAKTLIDFEAYGRWDVDDAVEAATAVAPTKSILYHNRDKDKLKYISTLEAYIMLDDEAQNKNLIDFLKGERKDLVL